MEILQEFAVPFYVFLTTLFAGWFLWSMSGWINALRPSTKFAALHDNLYNATWNLTFSLGHFNKAGLEALRYKLERLDIWLPRSSKELKEIIPTLLAYAKDGRIDEAQKLTKKWKNT